MVSGVDFSFWNPAFSCWLTFRTQECMGSWKTVMPLLNYCDLYEVRCQKK